jgi:hypothetical protein
MAHEQRFSIHYADGELVSAGAGEHRTGEDRCEGCKHLHGPCDGLLCDGCGRCASRCLCDLADE